MTLLSYQEVEGGGGGGTGKKDAMPVAAALGLFFNICRREPTGYFYVCGDPKKDWK